MKYRLADAMKQCMRSSSAEKITVQEIADAAGTTRQTFYRHFLDKYDLMNWYFDKILQESFKQMGEGRTVYEGLVKKFEFIEEENTFFRAAFQSDAQNNLKEHDFQMILRFYTRKNGRSFWRSAFGASPVSAGNVLSGFHIHDGAVGIRTSSSQSGGNGRGAGCGYARGTGGSVSQPASALNRS